MDDSITVKFDFPEAERKHVDFKFPVKTDGSFGASGDGQKKSLLINTVREVDEVSNSFLTKMIESKGYIGCFDFPRCPHGFPYTIHECLYSPSHFTRPDDMSHPDQVITNYVQIMLKYSEDLKRFPIDGEFNIGLGKTESNANSGHKLDIYGAKILPKNSPIFAFIHGGYWQFGSRETSKSMVRSLVSSGILVAVIGYDLAPNISMEDMVSEISESLSYLNSWALERNSVGLFVSGHSAGAHLAFMGLQNSNLPLTAVKGLLLFSGVYDLESILNTYINENLKLNLESAQKLSPLKHLDEFGRKYDKIKVAISVGSFESPTFIENGRHFFNLLSNHYPEDSRKFLLLKDDDHFSFVGNLSDMNSEIFKFVYDFIQSN